MKQINSIRVISFGRIALVSYFNSSSRCFDSIEPCSNKRHTDKQPLFSHSFAGLCHRLEGANTISSSNQSSYSLGSTEDLVCAVHEQRKQRNIFLRDSPSSSEKLFCRKVSIRWTLPFNRQRITNCFDIIYLI